MAEVKYTVRNMLKEDIPKALDVWRETGMQAGKYSLYTWLEVDPEAFKLAVTDEGEIIGVCAATIHHEDLAFIGLYCVKEKYRGLGIGLNLWNACMEHIDHRNACLYAIPEKADLYRRKGGFPIVEYKWIGFEKWSKSPTDADKLSDTPPKDVSIEPFEESRLRLMYEYDKKLIGYNRQLAIKFSCKEPESKTYLALKKDQCVGFGSIKMSCQGNPHIEPLYADEKEIAEVLLKKLIFSLPQENGLSLTTLSNNHAANELLKKIGLQANYQKLPFLYRKKPLDVDTSKIYAIFGDNFSI